MSNKVITEIEGEKSIDSAIISHVVSGKDVSLSQLLDYTKQLPPGDASTGPYWQSLRAGLYTNWKGTAAGDKITNTPFPYGYYLVLRNNFTAEPLVYGFQVDTGSIWSIAVSWSGGLNYRWKKIV